ncbi:MULTISPECIES: RnfABCDGE type electron transport complex subunit D [Thiomicrorhabdus]|uniref:Ion-translocating oxidoreductase complex subunit D n=1 Tax=Thiomicrorhabdus heinhorstiae TaxID=2748010 RepID=A0ABS0BY55_9GAMM|nr:MULTISPECIES: RnfABCDGE type electron transport complex subunit D [Thiomicrorhabdus]MBF6057002.1 RnfABCDGE type electron transport complex subunit D [Thiomicrorhabdus heinhorstiae]
MNDRMQSSPFAHNDQNVRKVMMQVQIAALPALLVHLYFFGFGIVVQWLLAVITLIVVESAMLKLRGRPILPYLTDLSGLITITGLVFCIPPTAPWWIIVTGSAFALIFGKHLYGGLGYNPFNPAMLGYAFLLISFPVPMTQWILPAELSGHYIDFMEALQLIFQGNMNNVPLDMMTGATPLNELRIGVSQGISVGETLNPEIPTHTSYTHHLLGFNSWEWINITFMLGGVWMLYSRTIRWQFPVGFLGSLALMAWIFHSIDPNTYPPVDFVLLTGGTMLAAFFIITDPVTASTTPTGRFIYACGIGVLVYVIRNWGAFPDGLAFAILLMNIAVPLIDQYTQPRVFGHKR